MSKKFSMSLALLALAIGLMLPTENSWSTPLEDAEFADGRMTGGGSVFTDEND